MSAVMTKTCKNCGRSFFTRDKDKQFCNLVCEKLYADGITQRRRANEFIIEKKICVYCRRKFRRRYSESYETFEKRRFCSISCASRYRKETDK